MSKFGLLLLSILIFAACSTYSDTELKEFDRTIEHYLSKNGIQCKKSPSGLYYSILNEGEGHPIQYKDIVSFTYKGSFLDGKVFDEQKEPVEYPISELIGAWKEIMLELKPGGKAYLVAPPQLAYGTKKLVDIPESSILIFELEVVQVK